MPTTFVGIDASQAHLDVRVLPADHSLRVDNTPAGHRQLVAFLVPFAATPGDLRIVLESTGGLEFPAALALEAAGFEVAIIKPERARYFAKASGQLAKTDALDARLLAAFAQAVTLTIRPLPTEDLRQFRDLLDRRAQLIDMRTMEKNRLASTTLAKARHSVEKHIAWIDREVRTLQAELNRRIADHPKWKDLDALLQSVPGVGPQTARTLIGQLPELGQVDRKAIGHLVGLAPLADDSGGHQGSRRIVGGRRQVRNALYMATVAALRHNPVVKAFYHRLRAQGKKAKVAVIAAAHKLLTILNAMVRDHAPWRHSTVTQST